MTLLSPVDAGRRIPATKFASRRRAPAPQRPLARLVSLIAAITFSGASPAQARPPAAAAAAAPNSEAKRHFEVGVKLFREQSYDAALGEFQKSYELGHRYTALRNIAQCQRELHQFPAAYESLEKLLSEHGTDLKEAEKTDAKNGLADLALATATLDVGVNPAGADVLIDGIEGGKAPLPRPVRLNVGAHHVRVQKAGFEPGDKDILLVGQQAGRVDFVLKAPLSAGHVAIRERSGRPLRIFVDGRDVGPSPWEGDLTPGPHAIEGKGDLGVAASSSALVIAGGRIDVFLDALATSSHTRISVEPATATIVIDGREVAKGVFEGELAVGPHQLSVQAPGFTGVERTLDALAGRSLVQELSLSPVAAPPSAELPPPSPEGMYGELSLIGEFQLQGTDGVYSPCRAAQTCNHSSTAGGGLALRVGYNFDPIGIEVAGMFAGDYRSESMSANGAAATSGQVIDVTSDAKRSEDLYVGGYHAFLGIGARLMSRGSVRFTFGLTPGIMFRNYVLGRTVSISAPNPLLATAPFIYTDSASQSAFGFMTDAGILIGGTTGTKLSLGLMLWVDFATNVRSNGGANAQPTIQSLSAITLKEPQYPITNSVQVAIGPTLGLHFGP